MSAGGKRAGAGRKAAPDHLKRQTTTKYKWNNAKLHVFKFVCAKARIDKCDYVLLASEYLKNDSANIIFALFVWKGDNGKQIIATILHVV